MQAAHCRIEEGNIQCKLRAITMKESTSGQHVELGKHGYEILGLEQTHQGDRVEPGQVPYSNFSWRNWTDWITVE